MTRHTPIGSPSAVRALAVCTNNRLRQLHRSWRTKHSGAMAGTERRATRATYEARNWNWKPGAPARPNRGWPRAKAKSRCANAAAPYQSIRRRFPERQTWATRPEGVTRRRPCTRPSPPAVRVPVHAGIAGNNLGHRSSFNLFQANAPSTKHPPTIVQEIEKKSEARGLRSAPPRNTKAVQRPAVWTNNTRRPPHKHWHKRDTGAKQAAAQKSNWAKFGSLVRKLPPIKAPRRAWQKLIPKSQSPDSAAPAGSTRSWA